MRIENQIEPAQTGRFGKPHIDLELRANEIGDLPEEPTPQNIMRLALWLYQTELGHWFTYGDVAAEVQKEAAKAYARHHGQAKNSSDLINRILADLHGPDSDAFGPDLLIIPKGDGTAELELGECAEPVKLWSEKAPSTYRFDAKFDHREMAIRLAFSRSRPPNAVEMQTTYAEFGSIEDATQARDAELIIQAVCDILEIESGKCRESKTARQKITGLLGKHSATERDVRKLVERVLEELPGSHTYQKPVN
jgi:hypothetical protein